MSDEEAVLRRAARLVREHGLFACPGPWAYDNDPELGGGPETYRVTAVRAGHEALNAVPLAVVSEHWSDREPDTAAWIAITNPDMTEPLAGLLDAAAEGAVKGSARSYAVQIAEVIVTAAPQKGSSGKGE